MDDLRIKAFEYALQARANAEEDIVELAMRILCFLRGYDDIAVSGPMHKIEEACGLVIPPPLPDLVQQVQSDADLSKADQTPLAAVDHEARTRLIRRAETVQFTEAG
jgi:hypothetical protein